MKIKLIDTFCTGIVHMQFNASLLAMLSLKYEEVLYYASYSNKENVYSLIQDCYPIKEIVFYKKIFVWEGSGRIDLFLRYIVSFFQNMLFLFFSKKSDLLIFNYNNPLSLRLLNLCNAFLKRKILIFCHGEMELMLPHMAEGGLLHKVLRKRICLFFMNNRKNGVNMHFCVIGKSVLDNCKKVIPQDTFKKFHYIDHPYIYTQKVHDSIPNSSPYIGIVGAFSSKKGGTSFLSLAKKLCEKNVNNVRLSITGRIYEKVDDLLNLGVDLPTNQGREPLPVNEFCKRIKQLKYMLFLYPVNSYQLIASGAIMDAINFECPIIALKNQYFEYVFKKYGAFGHLFDSEDDIYMYINSDVFVNEIKYDFSKIKDMTSPERIVMQLESIIRKVSE